MDAGPIPTFGRNFPPTGWKDVMQRVPALFSNRDQTRVDLTAERRRQLNDVNRQVHRDVIYADDRFIHRKADHWTLPVRRGRWLYGDCEDFVLEKIRRLTDLGWPRGGLYITFCRTETLEWHLVLTVDIDDSGPGTLVLDNRLSDIRPWQSFGWALASDPWSNSARWMSREGPGLMWQKIGWQAEPTLVAKDESTQRGSAETHAQS